LRAAAFFDVLDQPVSCFGDDGTYLYINDAGLKVLVLDDDLDALVLVRAVLESSHAVVKTVSSVDEAGRRRQSGGPLRVAERTRARCFDTPAPFRFLIVRARCRRRRRPS